MILFLAQTNFVKGQFIAEAGQDIVVCSDWNGLDTIQIGGNPTATGGIPPYTYFWETTWDLGLLIYTASDFLNDTSIANPSVVSSGEDLTFYLTVIDSESNISTDSVQVGFTNYGTHLGYGTYYIEQGDSVFLSGMQNVFGGFPPLQYLWRPNHGLSDSTSLSFWAKPDSSVAYYLSVTDSSGCIAVGAPVYHVSVTPSSVELLDQEKIRINAFPNPTNGQISITIEGNNSNVKEIEFIDTKGQIVLKTKIEDNTLKVNSKSLSKGLSFYKITESGRLIGQGKIIVE